LNCSVRYPGRRRGKKLGKVLDSRRALLLGVASGRKGKAVRQCRKNQGERALHMRKILFPYLSGEKKINLKRSFPKECWNPAPVEMKKKERKTKEKRNAKCRFCCVVKPIQINRE